MKIRVNNLKRTDAADDGIGSNSNVLQSLRVVPPAPRRPEFLVHTAEGWVHGYNRELEDPLRGQHTAIPHRYDVSKKIADMLASADSGVLEVELVGSRSFVVPAHLWPSFEIVG